jgi:hypothetical protein
LTELTDTSSRPDPEQREGKVERPPHFALASLAFASLAFASLAFASLAFALPAFALPASVLPASVLLKGTASAVPHRFRLICGFSR